jgi:hypothetical protein
MAVSTGIRTVRSEQRAGLTSSLRSWFPPSLVVAAVTAVLGLRFFLFIRHYSVNVLFLDQWGFLTPFFHGSPGIRELFFEQWGPHREGVGLIADKLLYPVTRWSVPAESYMIGACIFAAMLLALLLKRKLLGPLLYSDAVIPMVFLSLMQYETLVVTPNPAYGGFPLLMIMLYCLALLQRRTLLRYGLVLFLNFLLVYTGFGVFMGAVTVGVFALECYRVLRRMAPGPIMLPLAGLLIAGLSLGSFFIHYTFWPAVNCFAITPHYVSLYPDFMARMFSHFTTRGRVGTVLFPGMLIILAIEILRLIRRDEASERALIGAVLLSYAMLFSLNTAIGRVCLGVDAAYAPRYMTLMIPSFLAAYFYLVSRRWRGKRWLVLSLFALLLLPETLRMGQGANRIAEGKRRWAACYVRTENIGYCDRAANFKIYPNPSQVKLKQKLDYLKQHRLNLFSAASLK